MRAYWTVRPGDGARQRRTAKEMFVQIAGPTQAVPDPGAGSHTVPVVNVIIEHWRTRVGDARGRSGWVDEFRGCAN